MSLRLRTLSSGGRIKPGEQAGAGDAAAVDHVAHQHLLVLVAQLRLHRPQVGAGLAEFGVQVLRAACNSSINFLRVEGFLHALRGLPRCR